MSTRLDIPIELTLDASGNGTASVQVRWGQRWMVSAVSTQSSETPPFPKFSVYRGSVAPSNLIASTYSGQRDVAQGDEMFFAGETLTVQWLQGVPGARATAHVIGTIEAV